MNKTTQTLLIVGGIAVVAWFAYQHFNKKQQSNGGTTSTAPAGGNNSTADLINAGSNAIDTLADAFS